MSGTLSGCQNGNFISLRSLRVSTRIKGPSSKTTNGGRSRGTCTGLGSAAMAAWTTAILAGSELTHCKPDCWATWIKSSTGNWKVCTRGRPLDAGAAEVVPTGADAVAASISGTTSAVGAGATGVAGAAAGEKSCECAAPASASGADAVTGAVADAWAARSKYDRGAGSAESLGAVATGA